MFNVVILFFYSFIVTVCVCHTALKGYLLTYLDGQTVRRHAIARPHFAL